MDLINRLFANYRRSSVVIDENTIVIGYRSKRIQRYERIYMIVQCSDKAATCRIYAYACYGCKADSDSVLRMCNELSAAEGNEVHLYADGGGNIIAEYIYLIEDNDLEYLMARIAIAKVAFAVDRAYPYLLGLL